MEIEFNPKLQLTKDGSHTLFHSELDQTYHSHFGAIQEAYHVFIKSGFDLVRSKDKISILEIGFGTGLNAFITYLESLNTGQDIKYYGLEKHPITNTTWEQLNFAEQLNVDRNTFNLIHQCKWDSPNTFSENFTLEKIQHELETFIPPTNLDLIYFDAFSPRVQPELWQVEVFRKLHNSLKPNGIIVTYSCKGDVKRAMIKAGFKIEKIPGPPGKREMLRGFA